jgi:hypothetical protein
MNKTKVGPKIAEIASKVFALLEPLASEDRQKVVKASLTLLGEASTDRTQNGGASRSESGGGAASQSIDGLSARATSWMKQHGLTVDQIERVFDITSDGVTVIASDASGKSAREKVHNAYVLQGLSRLLASGDATFDDKSARKVCEDLGCYDKNNHSTYMGDKGNLLAGSKEKGWKLTAPGLKHGAELVKQLTTEG